MSLFNTNKQDFSTHLLSDIHKLSIPAFTEASFVSCHSQAYNTLIRRLSYDDESSSPWEEEYLVDCWQSNMTDIGSGSVKRSSSHHSVTSTKSTRSQTYRGKYRKNSSYVASSASSISDKSLTSFPSFSPESPKEQRHFIPSLNDGATKSSRKASDPAPSIVDSLTTSDSNARIRNALFDDAPFTTQHVPGSIHLANDEHIERLIARHGAASLIRQIAEDLAQRDAQISLMRRKAEERERALRKIALECGLSNLDLETRLRQIEEERPPPSISSLKSHTGDSALEDLMSDAMSETVVFAELSPMENDATIRATAALRALENKTVASGTQRGWKDFLWGGTSKKTSRASSVVETSTNGTIHTVAARTVVKGRKTVLQDDLFQPPGQIKSSSRTSSYSDVVNTNTRDRKPSAGLATLALRLVAGNNIAASREADGLSAPRGRANTTGTKVADRAVSATSTKTTASSNTKATSKLIQRRPAGSQGTIKATPERWDTMGASPQSNASTPESDNYGPVEMDTILPFEAQPPTVTQVYNNPYNREFLTDRFGFIYDQRRKKRQKEAADKIRRNKRGSQLEMLSSARSGIAADIADDTATTEEDRPNTPVSLEDKVDDAKAPKRWQDYLKIATFPTELLSHTPSSGIPAFEVMEGGEFPKSPGITTEQRGFLPVAANVTVQPTVTVISETVVVTQPAKPVTPPTEVVDDTEPVKLLLHQLGEVHDSLQRERTVRWNEFLRKVRAERKRDSDAAAAASAATGDARSQRPMPEAALNDGEVVGVAGLGIKGKVGRAKWNEFKSLVLGGIPVSLRAKIWAECSGATALRVPGYYEDLVNQSDEDDDPAIVAQIQMDINRTLTDNIFFRRGPGVQKLEEVLLAYSRRNPEVGYCQGMNLITACLLLIMPSSEDAFWLLTSIIENILPKGYYDHSLLASRADQQVLRQYVSQILPKLSAHLDDLSIELEALTFQWFLSVFTDCLSAEALFRVWDVVFCTNDGSTFLFQIALALLKLNENELLKCETPAGVYTYINHQMTNHAISIDGLIHASEGLRKVVKREEVEIRRAKAIEAEEEMSREREAKNEARKAKRLAAASAALETPKKSSRATSMERDVRISDIAEEEGVDELTLRTPRPVEESEVEAGLAWR